MRLLFIRHGDPDYINDTLTEKGKKEAALLAARICNLKVKDFYVSPLGRAKDTASYTLNKLGREAKTLDWLQEFPAKVDINPSDFLQKAFPDTRSANGVYQQRIAWDILPSTWNLDAAYFDPIKWRTTEVAAHSDLCQVYDEVSLGLDQLLEHYGYYKNEKIYQTEQGNTDTIVCFCHFGVTCALLSHLWGISPFILWHSLAMAPTSVTEVYTEEREKGNVYFRASKIGDISHLYVANEEPSFSARFCEVYENQEERH